MARQNKNEQTAPVEEVQVIESTTTKKVNRILRDNIDLEALFEKLSTKSAVIRHLSSKEYTRSEIADALGIRYQHVRNVLVEDARKAEAQKIQAAQAEQNKG